MRIITQMQSTELVNDHTLDYFRKEEILEGYTGEKAIGEHH